MTNAQNSVQDSESNNAKKTAPWDLYIQDTAGRPIAGLELWLHIDGKEYSRVTEDSGQVPGLPRSSKPIRVEVKKASGGRKEVAKLEIAPSTLNATLTSPKLKYDVRPRIHEASSVNPGESPKATNPESTKAGSQNDWVKNAMRDNIPQLNFSLTYQCHSTDSRQKYLWKPSERVNTLAKQSVGEVKKGLGKVTIPALGPGNSFQARDIAGHPVTMVGTEPNVDIGSIMHSIYNKWCNKVKNETGVTTDSAVLLLTLTGTVGLKTGYEYFSVLISNLNKTTSGDHHETSPSKGKDNSRKPNSENNPYPRKGGTTGWEDFLKILPYIAPAARGDVNPHGHKIEVGLIQNTSLPPIIRDAELAQHICVQANCKNVYNAKQFVTAEGFKGTYGEYSEQDLIQLQNSFQPAPVAPPVPVIPTGDRATAERSDAWLFSLALDAKNERRPPVDQFPLLDKVGKPRWWNTGNSSLVLTPEEAEIIGGLFLRGNIYDRSKEPGKFGDKANESAYMVRAPQWKLLKDIGRGGIYQMNLQNNTDNINYHFIVMGPLKLKGSGYLPQPPLFKMEKVD